MKLSTKRHLPAEKDMRNDISRLNCEVVQSHCPSCQDQLLNEKDSSSESSPDSFSELCNKDHRPLTLTADGGLIRRSRLEVCKTNTPLNFFLYFTKYFQYRALLMHVTNVLLLRPQFRSLKMEALSQPSPSLKRTLNPAQTD